MISPHHGRRPPYELPSGIVYFHDWRYVSTGHVAWKALDGRGLGLWSCEAVPPTRLDHVDLPMGIRLRAQPAHKTEPVLTPDQAGELFLFGGTLVHDSGRYRLWYDSWPEEHMGRPDMGNSNYVRYAESDNGVDWRQPRVGRVERRGSLDNNIVFGGPLTAETGYHGGCVFRDPSAPEAERYKVFHLGTLTPDMMARYRQQRPDAIDPFTQHGGERTHGLFGGVSPDGLSWRALPKPLVVQNSDTHNVCEYDAVLGTYVAYCRSWYFFRRTIGRMETDDFRHWPLPDELFWPNAMMEPHDVWYANAKTMMPGTSDYHVMFPMRWNLVEDRFDFHLATSPDGIVWGSVPGGPVCQPGEPGAWDAGVVAPGIGLVDLPDDRAGLLIAGTPVPHKHPRHAPLGALAWAWWPKGRLVALDAPEEGRFALWPLVAPGRTVRLNMRTGPSGYVQVEASGPDGQVLAGRGFDDCDWLIGDHLDRTVTWGGQSDLGHAEGEPIVLRFRMRAAKLYSVAFR